LAVDPFGVDAQESVTCDSGDALVEVAAPFIYLFIHLFIFTATQTHESISSCKSSGLPKLCLCFYVFQLANSYLKIIIIFL
jgi:hypothetical protein